MTATPAEGPARGSGSWTGPALDVAWVSHPGHRRRVNDDRAAVGGRFAAVADGVGGAPGGGPAAEAAIAEFAALVAGAATAEDVAWAVTGAHRHVRALAATGRLPEGAATTLVAAVLLGDRVAVVHAGDSAAWLLEDGVARCLTPPQRRWDPLRGAWVLTAALGAERLDEPAVTELAAGPGTRLVLGTDGVLGEDGEYADPAAVRAAATGSPAEAAHAALTAVLAGEAADNATVAVLDVAPR